MALFCWRDAIAGAVVLPIFQIGPFFVRGIQDLQFHAKVGRIPFWWGANAQSVVCSRCEFELEAKDEVRILFGGVQVASLRRDRDCAVTHHVASGIAHPAGEGLPIKERLEFGFKGRKA